MTTLGTRAETPSMGLVLVRKEVRRYARHPLFLVGAVATLLLTLGGPDESASSLILTLVPAAGLGVIGVVVMASLTRTSDQVSDAAGAVAVGERTRTLALAGAVVVPLAVALVWLAWAVWAYRTSPPAPNGYPFGGVGSAWPYVVLFDLAVVPAVGGPMLGLVVGRWLTFRGAAPMVAVLLVLVTIVMQGIVEPLRRVRLVMPWTSFGGPFGVDGDPNREIVLTGSPSWYAAYLLSLCGLALLVALLHADRHHRPTRVLLVVVSGLAVALCILAITQGVTHVLVNPLPGPAL